MEEQLILLETAISAWQKGFDPQCWEYYYNGELRSGVLDNGPQKWNSYPEYAGAIAATSQSLLQRWLREKHGIHVWLIPAEVDKTYRAYVGHGIKLDLLKNLFTDSFTTYEQALEKGLQEALKLIKD